MLPSPFMAKSKLKPKNLLTGSRISHLHAYTSIEHAHPSYALTTLQMALIHWVI
jgi:hypothetical protein